MRKTLRVLLMLVVSTMTLALSVQGADPTPEADAPPPPVPSDVQLRNGATLHKVSVVRWEKDRVVLKHAGGADPIRYVDIADSQKAAIMARGRYEIAQAIAQKTAGANPGPAQMAPSGAGANVNPNDPIVYQGKVFLPTVNRNQTNGGRPAEGVYKFSGATVYAFPIEAIPAFKGTAESVDLPHPLATATTNDEGVFTITVPPGVPHFLYCQAQRPVPNGTENCAWAAMPKDLKNPAEVVMTTPNRVVYRKLNIAP